nr:MAG TPA: hypothetical protein [Ackermannviridae sp.]
MWNPILTILPNVHLISGMLCIIGFVRFTHSPLPISFYIFSFLFCFSPRIFLYRKMLKKVFDTKEKKWCCGKIDLNLKLQTLNLWVCLFLENL